MDLQQDRNAFPVRRRPRLDRFQQVQGIHALDQGGIRKDQFQFVRLQMADKMPFHVGRHLRYLGRQFLRTALRKDPLADRIGLLQTFDRMEFGNCRQAYPGRQFLFDLQ